MFIKRLATVLFILASAAVCFGQAAKTPDLSGTWKLRKIDRMKIAPNSKAGFSDMVL